MSGNSLRDQLSGLMQARKQQAQAQALEAEKKKAARITKEKNKSTEKKEADENSASNKANAKAGVHARLTPAPGLPVSQRAKEIIEPSRKIGY